MSSILRFLPLLIASASASPWLYLAPALPATPNTRQCGVPEPSDDLRATHEYLLSAEPLDNALWNSSLLATHQTHSHSHAHAHTHSSDLTTRQAQTPLYTIETYIHIVSDTASSVPTSPDYVTDTMIQSQFTYLQQAYTDALIAFSLAGTDRTINDTWAANGDDVSMKTALRKGTYRTLNIYFQTQLQAAPDTPGVPTNSTLLGFCSLPASGITTSTPVSEYIVDGCNLLSGTMPNGTFKGYNLGGTTAHEVGHWNGLLHTFQDNTCDQYDWGDYVADTPQEAKSTDGCPTDPPKDSCPNSGYLESSVESGAANPYPAQGYAGVDPIHNFMDYSDDACYEGFTAGQGARMLNIWQIYREGL